MKNVLLYCSIFLSTSAHACWLLNTLFPSNEIPSSSLTETSQRSTSSSEMYKSQSASSSKAYISTSLPPSLPPSQQLSKMYADLQTTYSPAPESTFSSSLCSISPKPANQNASKSEALKRSYSSTASQSFITDSLENISSDDVSTNEDTSSTADQLITTSILEQREIPKVDLSCIIFNDFACSTICRQVCLLYNFKSTGSCTESKSCYCTIIGMKSPSMSLDQYQSLSLDDLWSYKFVKSTISAKILAQIKKYPKVTSKVFEMLHKPLRTGDDVKNRLITAYPEWTLLRKLKSRKRAPINRFIDDNYHLDKIALEKRIEKFAKKIIINDINEEFTDYLQKLSAFLDTIDDDIQLEDILKQVNDTKFEPLIKHTKNYLHDRGLDISSEDLESPECDRMDVDYVDNIVAGIIIKQILSTTLKFETSNIVKVITTESTQENATSSTSTKKSTSSNKSKQTSNTTDETDNLPNSDQCSCTSKTSTSTTTTSSTIGGNSRWELPGFDFSALQDTDDPVDEVWQTSDYYVRYRKYYSGAIDLEWKKGDDQVYIQVQPSEAISQSWYLDEYYITISEEVSGATSQSWDLGDVNFTYTKAASGQVQSYWWNGNRDQSRLQKYKNYITDWCAENYFLIEKRYCDIYET